MDRANHAGQRSINAASQGFAHLLCGLVLLLTACDPSAPKPAPEILLFNGSGTSPNDVAAVERVLKDGRLNYSKADSARLNGMTESDFLAYRLLIIPGGNYLTISEKLSTDATANIHHAVQGGLNYLGICAGGLLAGNASSNSINLTAGVRVGFYAVVNQGIHKAAVPIATVGAPPLEHYWEDGPHFAGWGAVVGKYPDGTPAIVQGSSGKGWVVLCGVHPEAPENWRGGMHFNTAASEDNAYAGKLVEAALKGAPLSHY